MRKTAIWLVLITFSLSLLVWGCGSKSKPEGETPQMVTTASGLKYNDVKVGTGDVAVAGAEVEVHYTGWLYANGQKGIKFDSSRDRNKLLKFPLGAGRVIHGWDEGVQGMKVGGVRELLIPSALGYGAQGFRDLIPPNATLFFEVELFKVIKK